MRRAAKVDDNHKDIVAAFRKGGAHVLDVSQLKHCCDIMIAYQGVTIAVEIKDGCKVPSARKLTEGESKFAKDWTEKGGKWSSKYKKAPADLTPAEQRAGLLSMTDLVDKIIVWAATDLNLDVVES